jgi:predicted RNase H-like HicB family nuclease
MDHYVALVHKEKGSSYGISFPDFPGCIAAAGSYAAAVEQAAEALAFHVGGMQQDGLNIPAPRNLEAIRKAADDWVDLKNAIVALVPLLPPASEPQAISASLDKSLLQAIDRYADAASMTRSAVLSEGAKLLMTMRPRPAGLREEAAAYRAQAIGKGKKGPGSRERPGKKKRGES